MFRTAMCLAVLVLSVVVVQASAEPVPGPLHYWEFDEAGGILAADSISGNNGTLNNWGAAEPRWVGGKIGGALDFGDTDNYVITDSPISLDQYTIAFWLKVHAEEGLNPRIVGPIDGYHHWVVISYEFDRGVGFYYNHGRTLVQDPNTPTLGLWEHYAVVFDRVGEEAVIYRDGAEVNRGTFTDSLPLDQWVFGHNGDVNNQLGSLNGQMDDLRIYNRLLDVDEIRALIPPEPSAASFASTLETVLNVDFGTLIQGDPSPTEPFEIWNIADPVSGVDLDLLSISGSGDTSLLTTDLSPFTDLGAGSSNLYTASLNTSTAGDFSATYALSFSDELGTDQLLTLNLTGSVVPEPSTLVLLGMGVLGLLVYAWRRRGSIKRFASCLAALLVVALSADAGQAVEIELVTVGNPGNAGEWSGESYGGSGPDRICGAVDYVYGIGKYEVTAGQYRDFLNEVDPDGTNSKGLYNSSMNSNSEGCQITWNGSSYDFSGAPSGTAADWENRPVNYVSWYDAAMFANWLTSGNIHLGAYDTSGAANWGAYEASDYTGITAHDSEGMDDLVSTYGTVYVIPTEDEWYKAAYHKNDGVTGNYFDYPTSGNATPNNDLVDPDPGNNATFNDSGLTIGSPYYRTEFGAHENSASPYDTFDQGGNVWEWNETAVAGSSRGMCGGSWGSHSDFFHASYRYPYGYPKRELFRLGFRVASIPEPGSLAMLAGLALTGLLYWWWRHT